MYLVVAPTVDNRAFGHQTRYTKRLTIVVECMRGSRLSTRLELSVAFGEATMHERVNEATVERKCTRSVVVHMCLWWVQGWCLFVQSAEYKQHA